MPDPTLDEPNFWVVEPRDVQSRRQKARDAFEKRFTAWCGGDFTLTDKAADRWWPGTVQQV